MVLRIITHEATRGQQLSDILERWTLDEVDEVNVVLDSIDSANARAMKAAQQKGGR